MAAEGEKALREQAVVPWGASEDNHSWLRVQMEEQRHSWGFLSCLVFIRRTYGDLKVGRANREAFQT